MDSLGSLQATLADLQQKRAQLDTAIAAIEQAIFAMSGTGSKAAAAKGKTRTRKPMSDEAKARIREAQQKRWTKAKGEGAKA